jgi:cytochrome b pre-mRNA-processing protein 3
MIFHLFRRTPRDGIIASLYGTIVAQARAAAFYQNYGVPDTVNGRFEMIVLHAVLLLHRLGTEPEPIRRLGQAVFDRFCRDMDANLREMGVGDLAVPRKMRRIGEAFYGRQRVYEVALAALDRGQLAAALARNVFGEAAAPGAGRLAGYVREAVRHLAAQDGSALSRGALGFPNPDQQTVEDYPLTTCCDNSDDAART